MDKFERGCTPVFVHLDESPYQKIENNDGYFCTLGELRRILDKYKDLPDSTIIRSQVAAVNHSAWNMFPYLTASEAGNYMSLVLRHPELKVLNKIEHTELKIKE